MRSQRSSRATRSRDEEAGAPWAPMLAAAIRRRRRSLKLTQLELAQLARCGPMFLYELESGKPTVRLDKLLQVLHVLGLQLKLELGRQTLQVEEPLQ